VHKNLFASEEYESGDYLPWNILIDSLAGENARGINQMHDNNLVISVSCTPVKEQTITIVIK
jgi:hypothetical protein